MYGVKKSYTFGLIWGLIGDAVIWLKLECWVRESCIS